LPLSIFGYSVLPRVQEHAKFGLRRDWHLPESLFENLAHGVPRQVGQHQDFLWHFVIRQFFPHELLDDFFFKHHAVVWGDERNRLLAPARIRFADNRRLFHSRKLVNDFLDFSRIHIDTVDEQHVFLAISDKVVAIGVPVADVSRQEPPLAHHRGGFLGLVPVADHHVSAAHAQLADLTGFYLLSRLILDSDLDLR